MASREELLAQAKEIQRQKLLERAKAIQKEKLMQANEPEDMGVAQSVFSAGEGVGETLAGMIGRGLNKAKIPQALNYIGGATRTGLLAPAMEAVTGKDVYRPGDFKNALKGEPLSTAQMLERAQVPAGASLSDYAPYLYNKTGSGFRLQAGGWADPTARGAAGFVGDVVTDPLTYGTLGIAPALKAAGRAMQETPWLRLAGKGVENVAPAVLNPATEGLQPLGKSIYKSAFGQLDELSRQKGKIPVSDVLWRNKISGTAPQIGKKAVELLPKYEALTKQYIDMIDAAGIAGNLQGAVQKGIDYANRLKLSRIPEEQAAGQTLLNIIKTKYGPMFESPAIEITPAVTPVKKFNPITLKTDTIIPEAQPILIPGVGPATAGEMQRLKQLSGASLSPKEWEMLSPQSRDMVTRGQKIIGGGLKSEVEGMAGKVSPALEAGLKSANADQAALITAAKKLNANALSAYNKKLVTPVDMITYSVGEGLGEGGKHAGMTAVALKKLGDLYKTPLMRTTAGRGVYNLGAIPGMDEFLRRPNIWQGLLNNEEKETEE